MFRKISWCILAISLGAGLGLAAELASGTISGVVKDSQTGEPLPGANVTIVKTSMGASTDVEGKYTIRDVPAGSYTLRATYVGYKERQFTVQVKEGEALKQDFRLVSVGVEGEEVVVTAQARGQKEAINQQLASMPVMNVVSAARIQELPDANAAESVGRLPGVSLIRTGGEGSKVVIRGLSPQYNQITIDGVELTSNVNSQNSAGKDEGFGATGAILGDRGVDLSMVSSSQLGGIEVIKAITPDMDASALGGVVNFDMRKAAKEPVGEDGSVSSSWLPHLELNPQAGYNRLKKSYNNYRMVGSLEKRLFDNALGFFLQATAEQRDLSSHTMSAGYVLLDKSHGDAGTPNITSVNLSDVKRTRKRVGGTLVLDYQHATGSIGFMNALNQSNTRALTNGENADWQGNAIFWGLSESYNKLQTLTNILRVTQELPFFRVNLKLSHTYSQTNNPDDPYFSFRQMVAGYGGVRNLDKATPQQVMSYAVPNVDDSYLLSLGGSNAMTAERAYGGALDLENSLTLSDLFSGSLKIGGSVLHRTRQYDANAYYGSGFGPVISKILTAYPWLHDSKVPSQIVMSRLLDPDYDGSNFLKGEFIHDIGLKSDVMWLTIPLLKSNTNTDEQNVNRQFGNVVDDYNGWETKSAGYVMMTLNVGENIKILPGMRYQNLTTDYEAWRGQIFTGYFRGADTTVRVSHGYWLPMVHVRYSPLDWLSIHLAYTNTLNYADYSVLTPRYVWANTSLQYNNWRLRPARSENFDLVLSAHGNEIGLLTIDGFKKRITDLIFFSRTYRNAPQLAEFPDLPPAGTQIIELNTYINNPIPIDVWGIETEWQTNFWYLPKPFDGLVLTANFTHIFSEASYPRSVLTNTYDNQGRLTQTVTDTFYTTRLLNQPNDIVNLSLGYDYKGFSARISMLYLDNVFKQPDFWLQNRINSAATTRWDLAVKQELPWSGMQLYISVNNISGIREMDLNQKTLFPTNMEYYGMSADLGLRIKI